MDQGLVSAASAAPISSTALGDAVSGSPTNLTIASSAGVGIARHDFTDGSDQQTMDAEVTMLVAAQIRPYALLNLPNTEGPAADAVRMAAFVTSFALRYGPNGSFWAENPQLPYLPVQEL